MAAKRAAKRASKTVAIAGRITPEQEAFLDATVTAIKAERGLPADSSSVSRSDAIRRCIDLAIAAAAAPAHEAADAGEAKEAAGRRLAPDDVATIEAALAARTRAYSELSLQVRAIGHLLNQIAKLAHQLAKFGRPGVVPAAAVEGVGRRLDAILDRAADLARQDAHVEAVVRSCRS